jgi:hypothetical protein
VIDRGPVATTGDSLLARAARLLAALAGLAVAVTALVARPVSDGDAGEYLAMAESLWRHGTPELRPGDVYGLASATKGLVDLNFADIMRGYFEDPAGARLSYHFWGYSALAVPLRALLRLFGANVLRALPLANALLLSAALWAVASTARLFPIERLALTCLLLFSPALGFVLWPHPEVYTFSLVTLALVAVLARRLDGALVAASLASAQNPPLLVLVGAIWILALKERVLAPVPAAARLRALARAVLATLPALVPMVFFYVHFGTPSVVARQGASVQDVSLRKALELVFDLNIGLLPYVPVAVLALLAGVAASLVRRSANPALAAVALLLPMALLCTATTNWNHGTTGPSRYAVWMVPLVYAGLLAWRGRLAVEDATRPRSYVLLLAAAVATQAAIVLGRGGPFARPDYFEHSAAARFVLRHAPALYNPSHEIFVARTLHAPAHARTELAGPVVYRDAGECRKAWARPEDLAALAAQCGRTPRPRAGGAAGWTYFDF